MAARFIKRSVTVPVLWDTAEDRLSGARDGDGRLVVTSQVTRSQSQNLDDARAKVRELITAALIRPKPRRATRPTRTSREQRIAGKKQRSVVKRLRAWPGDWS